MRSPHVYITQAYGRKDGKDNIELRGFGEPIMLLNRQDARFLPGRLYFNFHQVQKDEQVEVELQDFFGWSPQVSVSVNRITDRVHPSFSIIGNWSEVTPTDIYVREAMKDSCLVTYNPHTWPTNQFCIRNPNPLPSD